MFTTVSGDATGVLMEQKFGSLENVLSLIIPKSHIDVSDFDKANDYSYNLKLLNFDKEDKKSSQKELLDFISNEVGFKWSFEPRKVKEWQMRVVNEQKLLKHISKKVGTSSMSKVSYNEIQRIGTLESFAEMLAKNKHIEFFKSNFNGFSGNFDIKVDNDDLEDISEELYEEYGIELREVNRTVDFLVIK